MDQIICLKTLELCLTGRKTLLQVSCRWSYSPDVPSFCCHIAFGGFFFIKEVTNALLFVFVCLTGCERSTWEVAGRCWSKNTGSFQPWPTSVRTMEHRWSKVSERFSRHDFYILKAKLSPKCNLGFFCECIWVKPSCKSIITTKEALLRSTVFSFSAQTHF